MANTSKLSDETVLRIRKSALDHLNDIRAGIRDARRFGATLRTYSAMDNEAALRQLGQTQARVGGSSQPEI